MVSARHLFTSHSIVNPAKWLILDIELEDIVATPCRTNDRVDDTLRTWLDIATQYKGRLESGARCFRALLIGLCQMILFTRKTT